MWKKEKMLGPTIFSKGFFSVSQTSLICIARVRVNPLPNDKCLVQIESICRRLNKCNLKTEIPFGMGKKHEKMMVTKLKAFADDKINVT